MSEHAELTRNQTLVHDTLCRAEGPLSAYMILDRLRDDFRVTYNEGVELITIRYYDQPTIDRVLTNKQLLLEQKSRYTVQLVARNAG